MSKKKPKLPEIPQGLRLIDTHTHLYFGEAYPCSEAADAVQRAIDAGVEFMIFPGVNLEAIGPMEELHSRFPENTALCAGIHPDDLSDNWPEQLAVMREKMKEGKYIAVGEIGIDLYRDTSHLDRQKKAFEAQLNWAVDDNLPVVIHCRDGLEETLEVLAKFSQQQLPRVLFHCFTGTPEQVRRIREVIPYALFAVNGVATFKNAEEVRDSIKEIGLDYLVLETDAPYLAPTPYRGSRNESAYVPLIAHAVAETLQLPIEKVAEYTTANAVKFFSL